MGLKPCKECGNEVSTQAKTCPHCGVDNPAPEFGPIMTFIGKLVLGVFAFFLTIVFFGWLLALL